MVSIQSGQIKDYNMDMCCFSSKQVALRNKNKHWSDWSQDNVSEYRVIGVKIMCPSIE